MGFILPGNGTLYILLNGRAAIGLDNPNGDKLRRAESYSLLQTSTLNGTFKREAHETYYSYSMLLHPNCLYVIMSECSLF